MPLINKLTTLIVVAIMLATSSLPSNLEAVTYVTDTGGYAYDESRAVTNWAPALALATLATVGIIAFAVQNSHDGSSCSSHCCHSGSGSGYCSYSPYSSSTSNVCPPCICSCSCHCFH